jgi:hypothetical protein
MKSFNIAMVEHSNVAKLMKKVSLRGAVPRNSSSHRKSIQKLCTVVFFSSAPIKN